MSGLQWPLGKIDLINRALALTGNNLINTLEDGSDEYNVCSPAYEDALAVLIEEHAYGWSTEVRILAPSPTAPADTDWDTAYPLPIDLLHLIWAKINQDADAPSNNQVNQPVLYDILNGQLVVNAQGGPPPPTLPQTPAQITIKGVFTTNAGPEAGTPLFVRALMGFVMSGIYRGLEGDKDEADKTFKAAMAIAQQARSRYDQQKPKRQFWNSRITASRRVRRPWPQIGIDSWGGSGTPG